MRARKLAEGARVRLRAVAWCSCAGFADRRDCVPGLKPSYLNFEAAQSVAAEVSASTSELAGLRRVLGRCPRYGLRSIPDPKSHRLGRSHDHAHRRGREMRSPRRCCLGRDYGPVRPSAWLQHAGGRLWPSGTVPARHFRPRTAALRGAGLSRCRSVCTQSRRAGTEPARAHSQAASPPLGVRRRATKSRKQAIREANWVLR